MIFKLSENSSKESSRDPSSSKMKPPLTLIRKLVLS
jgi:hypothetical protein